MSAGSQTLPAPQSASTSQVSMQAPEARLQTAPACPGPCPAQSAFFVQRPQWPVGEQKGAPAGHAKAPVVPASPLQLAQVPPGQQAGNWGEEQA